MTEPADTSDAIPLPDFIGSINSPTANAFNNLDGMTYNYGAKGTGNYTTAKGGSTTKKTEIDCSGAVCQILNSKGYDLDPLLTNAGKFQGMAKQRNITMSETLDGDLVLIKSKGKGIDHIGMVVVDDQGRRFLAESTSSYNGPVIVPLQDRLDDLESQQDNFSYEIVSLEERKRDKVKPVAKIVW